MPAVRRAAFVRKAVQGCGGRGERLWVCCGERKAGCVRLWRERREKGGCELVRAVIDCVERERKERNRLR